MPFHEGAEHAAAFYTDRTPYRTGEIMSYAKDSASAQPASAPIEVPPLPARTLDEIQEEVDRYIGQFKEGYWPPLSTLARITEEVGELARELNHRFGHKPKRLDEEARSLELEIGDVLFILTSLANSLNLRLDECFELVMHKYQRRDHARFERKDAVPTPSEPAPSEG